MATRLPPSRRRIVVIAVALGALLLGAGCTDFTSLDTVSDRLDEEGFHDVEVRVDQQHLGDLLVTADAPRGTTTRDAQDQAAETVWDTFPRRFDVLRTTIDGRGQRLTYAELEDSYGERPGRLDRRELEADWSRFVVVTSLAVLAVAVVGVGGLGLVILLMSRANRRKAAATPATTPWMPPGHAPVPPPGGWRPAPPSAGVALGKPDDGPPTPPPSWGAPPPVAAAPPGPRPRDPDAWTRGRRPGGPRPDADHTPPGWG